MTAGLTLAIAQSVQAISLDFVNVTGNTFFTSGGLQFNGDTTFNFVDATTGANAGFDFIINASDSVTKDAFGLKGNITGSFTIGAPGGNPETATVTSSPGATLSIVDQNNQVFSGAINWISLTRNQTAGNFNIAGQINLTGISYAGTSSDLLALMGQNNQAAAVIAFSFLSSQTIESLRTTQQFTSYSGDLISVPDGGMAMALLGFGMVAVEGLRRRLSK